MTFGFPHLAGSRAKAEAAQRGRAPFLIQYNFAFIHATFSEFRPWPLARLHGSDKPGGIVKTTLRIGDHVSDYGLLGTVVANIETGEFSADYTAAGWAYLKVGVLVMTDEAGLVHYPDPARLTLPD